ncbi:phosphotransferase [Robiginitalea sp. SC105]|uniref:phosphotransferase n=1 Tax=Robiginitalea sp. SC105 TaxID=2762332 RepID=UPI00163A8D24|nr:phosphotransferase [Robiginitalea sp. SC105]MBC2837816.1 phosphotransferase [Robiginitalea sp. SC105]
MKEFDTQTPPAEITAGLTALGWLETGETVREVSLAGEGNMNVVLRLQTDRRSLILKQSRPYVQKYPDIPAPVERIRSEYRFYREVNGAGIDDYLPTILGFDDEGCLMLMEDLGQAEDMTFLYRTRKPEPGVVKSLVTALARIHKCTLLPDYPENKELRHLNHQHIFVLPYMEDNGFSLDSVQPGLAGLAKPYTGDQELTHAIASLGERYLSRGNTLLHGDYYPGSWLQASGRAFIIDPEFTFPGFPEFDLGVMAGHLLMATMDPGMLPEILKLYTAPADAPLVRQVAGTEILRRLIGLAQLPMERSLEEKSKLLETARKLVLDEN